eukprot:TRINITY_DN1963_c0_g1_i2.p1 TRINITY_DN1963_c0_g1~~TRINITY_DN1963_c0_g1_i2.p1  ORF type:complete len:159 (-),score=41.82 TRINITY_DN1963_c0_g1_i2:78-554(-)
MSTPSSPAAKPKEKTAKKVDGDYQEPEFIQINVSDPQKEGEYTTYKIFTHTTFPEYKDREFTVRRRHKEFVALREHLRQKLAEKPKAVKFGELPPLPGVTLSSLIGQGRFDPEFIEMRRKGLEQFINAVANHNYFRFVPALHRFLQDSDVNFIDGIPS